MGTLAYSMLTVPLSSTERVGGKHDAVIASPEIRWRCMVHLYWVKRINLLFHLAEGHTNRSAVKERYT